MFSGRMECPNCERDIFGVPCPKCGKHTLNLTLISRYGKATCFACHSDIEFLPEAPLRASGYPTTVFDAPTRVQAAAGAEPAHMLTVTPRAPKQITMPSLPEARMVVEQCLVGLERAAQDRVILRAPDLRAVINGYLDTMQDVFALDTAMLDGTVTEEWLRNPAHLDAVARLCYLPLWPLEGALLPSTVQAWGLAVDDAARRWQYARRCWLADVYSLVLMPIVPGISTTNPAWHELTGTGAVVRETQSLGFLLHGAILRKARVLT